MFNVPSTVVGLLGIIIGIHLVRTYLLDAEQSLWWLVALAFIPGRYVDGEAALIPGGEVSAITSFFTHMFVHADLVHLAINSAWMLAFGAVMCRRVGALRFVAFTLACGVAGAVLFWALHPGLMAPVVGASGAIAGLMAGVMRFLFSALDTHQGHLLRERPAELARMPLRETLSDRRVLIASGAFVALNLLAMIGLGGVGEAGAIAWEAHLGGYFFGLLAFAAFDIAAHPLSPLPPDWPQMGSQ